MGCCTTKYACEEQAAKAGEGREPSWETLSSKPC